MNGLLRKFAFGLCVVLCCLPAHAGWTLKNSTITAGSTANPFVMGAFAHPLTPGSIIIVSFGANGTSIPVPTDDAGNTYYDYGGGPVQDHLTLYDYNFYALNTHSTALNKIYISNSGGSFIYGSVGSEWTGGVPSSPVDVYAITALGIAGSGTDNASTASADTTQKGDLIYGHVICWGGPAHSAGTGFTYIGNNNYPGEYLIQSSLGTVAATWTVGSGDYYGAIMVAFKQAPIVSLSASTLGFGAWPVGVTSSSHTETITNTGIVDLVISTVTITGTDFGDFSNVADTCSGETVTSGNTCAVSVTFTPSAIGSRSASLNFADNASDTPQAVVLAGTGGVANSGHSGIM